MDNFRRAMGDASTYLSRAVQDAHIGDEATIMYNRARQYTEEKLGKAERTENDSHFDDLANRTDQTKNYTEKLVKNTEAVLVPNPAARLETFMFDNIPVDKLGVKNTRLSNLEYLGTDMIEGGNEFGPATPYGSALIRVGQAQQHLGEIERNYIRGGHDALIAPMQKFLDSEMKNIMRERKILENKRLDLDACKNRVRKARAMQLQPPKDGIDPRAVLDQSEAELRVAQADYDKQVEITRLLMESLGSIQTNHLRYLGEFVESQAKYYAECNTCMQDLQQELSSFTNTASNPYISPIPISRPRSRCQVVRDYDALQSDEMSMMAHEVLNVLECDPVEEEWILVERGNKFGRVPRRMVRYI
ncbi:endophilin-B2-like isoform X2 [Tigriopus californicus]|uniref:endophilin-B2-like isoform X2 n=1 Tax=Tigriopus californicus TaxID=6832 RepID=UPI0027DA9454|nr:endophilin-B2-like isoform X2 [Tigriopus californicus]